MVLSSWADWEAVIAALQRGRAQRLPAIPPDPWEGWTPLSEQVRMVIQHGCVGLFNAADELKPLEMLAQTGAGIPVRARIALGSGWELAGCTSGL